MKIAATKEEASFSGVLVRQGDPELVAAINQALKDMEADGTYDRIAQFYFGQDVSK